MTSEIGAETSAGGTLATLESDAAAVMTANRSVTSDIWVRSTLSASLASLLDYDVVVQRVQYCTVLYHLRPTSHR